MFYSYLQRDGVVMSGGRDRSGEIRIFPQIPTHLCPSQHSGSSAKTRPVFVLGWYLRICSQYFYSFSY